jgi:PAS domain S-box-containing protein
MTLTSDSFLNPQDEPISILIVDDNPETALILRAALASNSTYRILSASSGEEALGTLAKEACALVLLDIKLPGIDGFETAIRMRARSRTRYTPIIFVTALPQDDDGVRRAYEIGAVDFLFQPVNLAALRSKVSFFVEQHRNRLRLKAQEDLLHRQEIALTARRGEEQLMLIADSLPVLIGYVGTDGRYRFCNRTYEDWFRIPRERIRGFTVRELVGEETFRLMEGHMEAAFRGERRDFELWLERPWLGRRALSICFVPDLDDHGGTRGYVTLATDVTSSKSIEAELERRVGERTSELERSQSFLDSLIEHLPNMIFVKDAKELRFVRFNKAGEELLGFDRADLIGKNDFDFFPKEQAEFFTSKDQAVLQGGALVDIPEEPISTKRGLRYLHTRKIPLGRKGAKVEYLLGISEDITERKAAEEKLRASQEELKRSHSELERRVQERTAQLKEAVLVRDEFLSIASHELKTPLTPLKLQLQSLLRAIDRNTGAEMRPDHVAHLIRSSDRQITRLAGLIEDLLDVSRITAGHLNLHREPVDLSQLVRETLDRHADQLEQAGCKVELQNAGPVVGSFDRRRMEQVITNLMVNAIKYAPGKVIRLGVRSSDGRAVVSIEDEGSGIPPEQLPRLFNRFERGGDPSHVGGLGLGLYISRQIIDTHGGSIHAESPEGKGARFTIELPL